MICIKRPDGGKGSGVKSWGLEFKGLFSIVLLRFSPNNRENYHSHAFNAITFWLKGRVSELRRDSGTLEIKNYHQGRVKYTSRSNLHKIKCWDTAWCISLRGPWSDTWKEYNETTGETITLTKGRRIV